MKIYLTTDTHFNHEMLTNNDHRPIGFEVMILEELSKVKGDMLIHLGDFCIGDDLNWIETFMQVVKPNFKKVILVRGNHDGKSYNWYINNGFDFVCEYMRMRMFGKELLFSHMPILAEETETTLYHKVDMNIHGHLHGGGKYSHRAVDGYAAGFHYDCAPDTHDYKPVNLQDICT